MSEGKRQSRRYDGRAATYDRRRTLNGGVAHAAAAAALALAGGTGTVVEIGAGTGEFGRHLAALAPRYVGLDLARPMLERFRAKLSGGAAGANMVQAECNRPWPLRDGVADAVIAARVLHLLDSVSVAGEARRVCRRGGCLLAGRVEHDEHGMIARLRRQRQRLFAERGIEVRGGEPGTRRLLTVCAAAGATPIERRAAGEWQQAATVAEVIAEWDVVRAWAGSPVDAAVQAEVQAALRVWAVCEFGSLERTEPCREHFTLEGVRFD